LSSLERADIVQGLVLPDPTAVVGPFDRTIWITFEVGLFETANLFVKRAVFDCVGGFEEWIRPRRGKALAEDTWFGYRARRCGAASTFCEQALAHHAVFVRGWWEYALERRRLAYFPAMAHQMPELRQAFLHRRVFLNQRTAKLDLALGGGILALTLSSTLPLVATVPYFRALQSHANRVRPTGPRPVVIAAVDVVADAIGFAAMAVGSVRYRSLVL
jgi:hypothetical protein